MKIGFLLKFQEEARSSANDFRMATTKTSVKKEQRDHGLVVPLAGTKTLTEVKREQADTDPKTQSFFALPR